MNLTLEEAQMKISEITKERKYPPIYSRWTLTGKIHSSRFIKGLDGVQVLLWREGTMWAVSLSTPVGTDGEWIFAGGLVRKGDKQEWKLPSVFWLGREVEKIKVILQRWGLEKDRYLNVIAMVKLAHKYTRAYRGISMIERIMTGIESGITSEATVAEALSIVQHRYCRNRLDRVWVCGVWRETFR